MLLNTVGQRRLLAAGAPRRLLLKLSLLKERVRPGLWINPVTACGYSVIGVCAASAGSLCAPGAQIRQFFPYLASLTSLFRPLGTRLPAGGRGGWYTIPTRGGLGCQLETSDRAGPCLLTDETWLARSSQSRLTEAHYFNDLYYQEVYTGGQDPAGWQAEGYDDSAWPPALVLGGATGRALEDPELPWQSLVRRSFLPLTRELHLPHHVTVGEVVERMSGQVPGHDLALRTTLEPVQPLTKALVTGEAVLLRPEGAGYTLANSDPYPPPGSSGGSPGATPSRRPGGRIRAESHRAFRGPMLPPLPTWALGRPGLGGRQHSPGWQSVAPPGTRYQD